MRLSNSLFFTLLAHVLSVTAVTNLSLEITGPATVHGVDNLGVITTLTNTGDETLRLLNDPSSPLSTLPADTFVISDAKGFKPAFNGVKVKYSPQAAVQAKAYTVLEPKQSIKIRHNLAEAYDFSRPGGGHYDIGARNTFYIVTEDEQLEVIQATLTNRYSAKLTGSLFKARPVDGTRRQSNFFGCSASQEADISKAAASAQSYASAALEYLESHTHGTSRFTTWFGSYTTGRHSTILSHFSAISGHDFSSFTYDCSCSDPSIYAYVYPNDFGEIYLCGAFWQAPLQGTDSQGGTLVHESSHFELNGGTRDFTYGQSSCKYLAVSNPALAIANADSHEYFTENNPAHA